MEHKGTVYFFTGLSGAGKTTVGSLFYQRLKNTKPNAVYLDDGLSGAAVTGNIFGPGASGDYIEAVKINCGHDTVITNNLFIDTRCAFNVYIAGNFAVGMTNDSGFGPPCVRSGTTNCTRPAGRGWRR